MQEQFPGAQWRMVCVRSFFILADMQLVQDHLTLLDTGIAILQIDFPGSQRFDLSSLQNDARLVLRQNDVLVSGLSILCDEFA